MTQDLKQKMLLGISERPLDARSFSPLAGLLGNPPIVAPEQVSRARVIVSAEYLNRLRRLSVLLDAAFTAIVGRYFLDERIRAIYQLPQTIENILKQADKKPYRVGFYRPDFVYDRDGQPRICEVGARYSMNGWMISHLLEDAAQKQDACGLLPQPGHGAFLQALREMHPPGSTVAMVHAREAGSEIFLAANELRRGGVRFLQAHPLELRARDGRLSVREQAVDRCILEMDRIELPLIPAGVLAQLIDSGAYFNDVRTLVLVHDKRVMAVLNQREIMRDCMSAADYAALQPFLIPSFAPASRAEAEALLARPGKLIAKRNSGGRGLGSLVRHACDEAAWRKLALGEWQDYMFQEYIEQKEFIDPESSQPIRLVGMQLCHNAVSYGPGAFRGSDEWIINVHQNRGKLYSATVAA